MDDPNDNELSQQQPQQEETASVTQLRASLLRRSTVRPANKQARHDKVIIWPTNGVFTFVLKD